MIWKKLKKSWMTSVKRMTWDENRSSPALTINIQSWWTPIIGVVLLIVGLLAGYFARPLISV